jgi:cytochrome c oxidase subunit 2
MIRSIHRHSVSLGESHKSNLVGSVFAMLLLYVGLTATATAQMYKANSSDAVPAADLYQACGFCHGDKGQGRQRLDAPALAGVQAWYLERQMHNFKNGIRGVHPDDLPGEQMALITGMFRNDATIKNVAAYIAGLQPGAPPMRGMGAGAQQPEPIERPFTWNSKYASLQTTSTVNVVAGKASYQKNCLVCHGADGLGIESLGAPTLTVQPLWYLGRQLQYFKAGIRGADPKDTFGAQMVGSAKLLADDQAIADVLAYIDTL